MFSCGAPPQYQSDCPSINTPPQHHHHHYKHHHQYQYQEETQQFLSPGCSRKERRRTENLNTAYNCLRDCLPNVPSDTKLTKIKTLKLATSYIDYLISILAQRDSQPEDFKPKLFLANAKKSKKSKPRIGNNHDKTLVANANL